MQKRIWMLATAGKFFEGLVICLHDQSRAQRLAMTYFMLAGEVFPTRVRGRGAGFAASFAKIGAVTTAFLFPVLLTDIGTANLLYILVGTSLLGAVITAWFGIETKGLNLETLATGINTIPDCELFSAAHLLFRAVYFSPPGCYGSQGNLPKSGFRFSRKAFFPSAPSSLK